MNDPISSLFVSRVFKGGGRYLKGQSWSMSWTVEGALWPLISVVDWKGMGLVTGITTDLRDKSMCGCYGVEKFRGDLQQFLCVGALLIVRACLVSLKIDLEF
jgi:hypothetical protein